MEMGVRVVTIPYCVQASCRLVNSSDLSLDAIFFTQFVSEITGGEAGKEIWLSVNYLFFISTSFIYEKDQQIRQGIV